MTLSAGSRLGPYEIVAVLGSGGMGEVYEANDPRLRRRVALKILPESVARDALRRERFEREAQTVAALSHPNIVTIYSVEQAEGVQFLTMELVKGQPLGSLIPTGGLPLDRLLQIAVPLADAISAAHALGITHRDLKPDNIVVTDDDHVKVLDFGLAKITDQAGGALDATTRGLTGEGRIVGTIAYMSPEQAEGKLVDHRSDLFSLGIILYQMASGEMPFKGDTDLSVLSAILRDSPPAVTDSRSDLPPALARVIRRCLEKDPTHRLQTAIDLRNELHEIAAAPAVASRRRGVSARAVAASAAALMVVAVLIFATTRWWPGQSSSGAPIDSIAVLPFVNASGSADADYLSDGVTETLTNTLAQIRALRVVPRTLAARYKNRAVDPSQAGRELNVRAVVTGEVAQRGDRLHIQADLIDVDGVAQLWGQRFDRPLADAQSVQAEITRTIAERLRLRLTPEDERSVAAHATHDPAAYELYLKGRHEFIKRSPDSLARAGVYFEQATGRDPSYASAYAMWARTFGARAYFGYIPADEGFAKAAEFARKALSLNDRLADPQSTLGSERLQRGWNWAEAESHYRRSLELEPNNPDVRYAYGFLFLRSLRRSDEAVAEISRAETLDPLAPASPNGLGTVLIDARRYDEAVVALNRALALDADFAQAHQSLARVYRLTGKGDRAIAESQRAIELGARTGRAALAESYAAAGHQAEARAILDELIEEFTRSRRGAFGVALVWAALGDTTRALDWLDRAYEAHDFNMVFLNAFPEFDRLRASARFQQLARRVGIPS